MPPLKDLTGQRFGRWTVIAKAPSNPSKQTMWLCKCDCGREGTVMAQNLARGTSTQCVKCRHRKPFDETGAVRLRKRGLSWPELAARTGVDRRTLQRRLEGRFDRSRYDSWMQRHGNYEAIEHGRQEGKTWDSLAAGTPLTTAKVLQNAFVRERARRLWTTLNKRSVLEHHNVKTLTAEGRSAEEIAEELGVSSRTVVRFRARPSPMPALDTGRIAKLRDRGLDWGDINRRLERPYLSGAELEVAYNFTLDLSADI